MVNPFGAAQVTGTQLLRAAQGGCSLLQSSPSSASSLEERGVDAKVSLSCCTCVSSPPPRAAQFLNQSGSLDLLAFIATS